MPFLPTVVTPVDADTSGFDRGMARAESRMSGFVGNLRAATPALLAVSTAVTAMGAGSLKAAVDIDHAMTGVAKTARDLDQNELRGLQLRFQAMSEDIPLAATELAGLAQEGFQLGISAAGIEKFVATTAGLRVATNLGDQAATSMARFRNIMGSTEAQIENTGSAVVDLGNNLATTEAEIVDMGLRIAGAGRVINLTEGEVLGLAGALSSVGVAAELGGTAISRVMLEIDSAVKSGADSVRLFAAVSGMAADDFAQLWGEDAAEAVIRFVEGIGRMVRSGEDITGVLAAMGLNNVRVRDTLLRAAAAADLMRESVERGNRAFEENTALGEEANRFYNDARAVLVRLKNTVVNTAAAFGEAFMPIIIDVAKGMQAFVQNVVRPFIQAFAALPEPVRAATLVFGGLLAMLGPLAVFVTQVLVPMKLLTGALVAQTAATTAATAAWVPYQTTMIGFTATQTAATAATVASKGALAGLLGVLTGPVGVIAAIAALGVGLVVMAKRMRDARREASDFQPVLKQLRGEVDGLRQSIAGMSREQIEIQLRTVGADRRELDAELQRMRDELRRLESMPLAGVPAGILGGGGASNQRIKQLRADIQVLEEASGQLVDKQRLLQQQLNATGDATAAASEGAEQYDIDLGNLLDTMDDGRDPVQEFLDGLRQQAEGLEDELAQLRGGTAAMLDQQIARAGLTGEARAEAEALRDLIVAREGDIDAIERQQEAYEDFLRSAERVREENQRIADDARRAADQAVSDAKLEKMIEHQRRIERTVDAIQRRFEDFIIDMGSTTGNFVEATLAAFGGLVDGILAELQRLAAQQAAAGLFGLIGNAIAGALGGGIPSAPGPIDVGAPTINMPDWASFQHGGTFNAGRMAIVGEAGPELVRFGAPGHVTSNRDLMQALASAVRTPMPPIHISIDARGRSDRPEDLRRVVQQAVREEVPRVFQQSQRAQQQAFR